MLPPPPNMLSFHYFSHCLFVVHLLVLWAPISPPAPSPNPGQCSLPLLFPRELLVSNIPPGKILSTIYFMLFGSLQKMHSFE